MKAQRILQDDTNDDTTIVRETLRLYGTLYAVSCLLFTCLRLRFVRGFSIRSWVPEQHCEEATKLRDEISWWRVASISDDVLLEECGMDAVCFCRALRFGRKLAWMGCLQALWLIPLYRTASQQQDDFFALISIANIPSHSKRFLGTVVAAYILFGYTMYLILAEYRWYTRKRHSFLAQPTPCSYAVYVSGIPSEYRSSVLLQQYFETISRGGRVLEGVVTQDLPSLEAKMHKRQVLIQRLEHAHAVQKKKKQYNNKKRQQWQRELDMLNQEIADCIGQVRSIHDPKRCQLVRSIRTRSLLALGDDGNIPVGTQSQPTEGQTDCELHPSTTDISPSHVEDSNIEVVPAHSLQNANDSHSNSSMQSRASAVVNSVGVGTRILSQHIETGTRAVRQGIVQGSAVASQTIAKHSRVAGKTIRKVAKDTSENGVKGLKAAVSSVGTVLPTSILMIGKDEGNPREGGFVTFTNLYDKQTVLQILHHEKPHVMQVQEAPDPKDIFWRNVGSPANARRTGRLAAVAASAVLCFFYTIPISFISSLTEVNSLKETLPKLGEWLQEHPSMEPVFAQIAPLLLLTINEAVLPSILKYFARWEGHVSSAMLEASLFIKLGCFMIIQTFFVSAISGGIMAELGNILDDPSSIIDLLANSLPAQSTYFVQIILASTCILQTIELLRLYPFALALLRRCIGPNLTEKERRSRWGFLRPLEDPPEFFHAETFGQLILFYMVFFVYSTIAPFTSIFLVACFWCLELGYRYNFIHNYPRAFETGGKVWKYFIQFILVSMVIAEFTLIGLLALKQSVYAGPALGPLLALTFLFIFYVNTELTRVSEYLPSHLCVQTDTRNEEHGLSIDSLCRDAFLQPSLKYPYLEPEYDDEKFWEKSNVLETAEQSLVEGDVGV